MSDPEKQWGPWVYTARGAVTHECPKCDCRARVRAIMWSGYNLDLVKDFLGHHAPDYLVEANNHHLVIGELVSPVPAGHWLYTVGGNGVLLKASAPAFVALFERP